MGILCLCREGLNMIKFVASACLVAAALADADPYYGAYGYGGYGLGYSAAVPFGSSTGLDPITQGLDASTQGYAPYAAYGGYYGKRSAKKEREREKRERERERERAKRERERERERAKRERERER